MLKILLPIDGSAHAGRAVEHVLQRRAELGAFDLHLLNVQLPLESGHAKLFFGPDEIAAYQREQGLDALRAARERLDAAGVPYTFHVVVGHAGETIARFAREQACDQIVMGSHGRSALTHLVLGSVASDVIRLADVPVTLVK
ncbi:nucleotide-binding universal stress UspA family protein [Plasticicumulans lactativorans]|uniref:Nucleotide-binding universal stress UspA family protein n=1 Tax=Plasticicumulans lactativorans TaxID=1133106 RepID=A0A4V2SDD7_9GAMM|nr:universal stress protein [Plasticicumulans lactativorans]TCO83027.1 nucleotide-binding universal stress UspA family protein [Plasticicumulans lactativorans]